MYSLALLALASFLLSLFLTPAVRNLARRLGYVDAPGDSRKIHKLAVPRVGGIAILTSYALAFAILFAVGLKATTVIRSGLPVVQNLLPAIALIFLTGLLDDIRGLKPWQKFAGQLLAAALAIWGGVLVEGFAGLHFPIYVAIPVTVLWIVGCSNAVNLIDGMDGLAAGVGLFATLTILMSAFLGGNIALALAIAPLAGALLGFLRYNFNPATIFLGDCGSLTIGFMLGCFGALSSQKAATVLGMTAPLMALAIPLLDTGLAIVRRFIHMEPVWAADRGHIHHRLLDRGMSPRKAALVLYAAAGIGAVLSIVQTATAGNFSGIVIVLFCAATWIGIQHLGYVEFGVAGRMFVDGAFRRQLKAQLDLEVFRAALLTAETPDDCQHIICTAAKDFGCSNASMRLAGIDYGHCNHTYPEPGAWQIHIPLPGNDFVSLERNSHDTKPNGVATFANVISQVLTARLQTFSVSSVFSVSKCIPT